MHLHLVRVEGENLHDLAGLVPPAGLAVVGLLVLDEDGVADREGREGAGADQESILHPPVPFGHGLGAKVSLQAPLASRLVLAVLAGHVVPEVAAEDDLGRADAGDRVGVVPVHEEGPGQLVSVTAATRPQVVHHQSFGGLHGDLRSLVGPRVVGGGHPVVHTPLVVEVPHGQGGEDTGAVRGDVLGHAPGGEVVAQGRHYVGRVISLELEDGQPAAVAVGHGEVGGVHLEEVGHHMGEGIVRLDGEGRWRRRLGGGVEVARPAALPVGDDVRLEAGPEDGLASPAQHPGYTVVGAMQVLQHLGPEVGGDEGPLAAHDDTVCRDEAGPVREVLYEVGGPVGLVLREARLEQGQELLAEV